MKRTAALLALSLAMPAFAGGVIKNGDFEKGKMGWDMDPGLRVVPIQQVLPASADVAHGQVLSVELHKSAIRSVSERLHIDRKTRTLSTSMKMCPGPGFNPVPPDAPQFTIRYVYPGGSTFSKRAIDPAGGWQEVKWDFSDLQGKPQIQFVVEFNPGSGCILVDDVAIEEVP